MIDLEVDAIHRGRGIAILSDGQEVPVTNWRNEDGECDASAAASCVCGPDVDGTFYAVDLSRFTGAVH